MAKQTYFVTYDLSLYTKPDIWDKEYKVYDKNTGYFQEIDGKPESFDENAVEIEVDMAQNIMKNLIHSSYSTILKEDNLKWYLNFEKEIVNRPKLLQNDELLFNYLMLKSQLAGIPENLALVLYSTYVDKRSLGLSVVPVEEIFRVLNLFIQEKKYWIPDITMELKNECMLIDDAIRKRSSSPDYKFEMFETRYLNLCNEGYIKKVLEYNKNSNNYLSKGYSFLEQKEFLLTFFDITTESLISMMSENYEYFKGNFASKKVLKDNMRRVLELAMKFWT